MHESESASPSPPVPDRFGDYATQSYVGHGSYGHVYVEHRPGTTLAVDEVRHLPIIQRHLKLWSLYVFTTDSASAGSFAKLGRVAQTMFAVENELNADRRQVQCRGGRHLSEIQSFGCQDDAA
jgi:hypothetical protein